MQSSGISAHPRDGGTAHRHGQDVRALSPRALSGLGSEQIQCMLSWPKRRGKRGQQARGDAEGWGGKTPRGPLAPSHCLRARPHGLYTFSAGGRGGSHQGHKGNESDSKHLAKMYPSDFYLLLCSKGSSLAAKPKSPTFSSMASLIKKFPGGQQQKKSLNSLEKIF